MVRDTRAGSHPFQIPALEGQRYERLVPDTLDIQERASLAIRRPTDPECDYDIYAQVDFFRNPPVMWHGVGDSCESKFMEAVLLLRIASGSDLNFQVEQGWMRAVLDSVGPDGLLYLEESTLSDTVFTMWSARQDHRRLSDSGSVSAPGASLRTQRASHKAGRGARHRSRSAVRRDQGRLRP